MDIVTALWILAALIVGATLCGVLKARSSARVKKAPKRGQRRVTPADLELGEDFQFGEQATLVQFSTQFCSKCPGTARLLSGEAETLDGVTYVDIDLTEKTDLARRFNVLQTPTILVLDREGDLRARITGAPTVGVIRDELLSVGALPYNIERNEKVS